MQRRKAAAGRVTWVSLSAILGVLLVVVIANSQVNDSSTRSGSPVPTRIPPPISITAKQLYERFHANEARANRAFKGRTLIVHGEVDRISEQEVFGGYTVSLKTSNMFASVECMTKDADFALSLDRGDAVVVVGIGDGQIMGSPFIQECKLRTTEGRW